MEMIGVLDEEVGSMGGCLVWSRVVASGAIYK